MASIPKMLMADPNGNIIDNPRLLMCAARGEKIFVPKYDDLVPLPRESELFLLPGRMAIGFNPKTGKKEISNNLAVAAFAAPGYTLNAHPAYSQNTYAPTLPLFAYGAVGYADGRFWISARKVDNDPRQIFSNIPLVQIEKGAEYLIKNWPENRLVAHIIENCVKKYACPAARNFALGRYEAPLPSSQSCNARCLACISSLQEGSGIETTPQCRIAFTPKPEEIAEVMLIHESREKKTPVYSFGQGCEGDPLLNSSLLAESIRLFRSEKINNMGNGTINCNTNGSIPEAIGLLADRGLSSIRVSLNSSQPHIYESYYRPQGYNFSQVEKSLRIARSSGLYVSLNLLFFPGLTDTQQELESLNKLCGRNGVSMIQWRNLNVDPAWYYEQMKNAHKSQSSMGLKTFMKKLKKACPWLDYGYFNPYVGNKARLKAPDIS